MSYIIGCIIWGEMVGLQAKIKHKGHYGHEGGLSND